MKEKAPRLQFVFHDAYPDDSDVWNDMFSDDDMDNVIMDTHQYMAWWGEKTSIEDYIADYRTFVAGAAAKSKYPVWFGEWALGTD